MQMPSKQRNFVREALEVPEPQMDVIDRRIIAELQDAPRLRVAELARRIGLSGPAVADRLRRLDETGTLSYRLAHARATRTSTQVLAGAKSNRHSGANSG